ncbi:MAG: hypothetical protein DYG98_01510 [Haliscomenobacteraceae bacterium CHB4]|nr:hypothetical protein [Saprospiraceae bacterium]MCE7921708.1 hypothetical protein [Haliscomenobacteraceae bacterium CHB4]
MENKLPHDPNFEQFVRQALQKTDGTPDENTWAGIAAQQGRRNVWLRIRHYGLRFAPVVIALVLAVAGWKYFAAGTKTPSEMQPEIPQQTAPAQQPQVNAAEPVSPDAAVSETAQAKSVREQPAAGRRWNSAPAATVRFAAEEGLRYENPATGTSVYIPANSLVNAHGKPVSGEVEFELREFRSIPDFLTSGIPMHYADERGEYFFNSGGMFDLRVNQNGKQLQMAAGQACDVRFTSTHQLTQPSLYYFDETENAWKYQPDPAFTTSELPPVVTETTVVRDNLGLKTACLPHESIAPQGVWAQPQGEEAVAFLQDAVQTGYDYAFGKVTMPGWFRKHSDWNNEQLLSGLEHSVIRMKRHKDTDDMFFPEDVNNVFTELKAFKDCYFIVNDGLGGKKSFTKEDFDSYWDRVSVVQENGALCYVSFLGKQGLLQFYATLTGSTENSNFDADKVLAEYTHLRNQRQQNFEKQANSWRRFYFTAQMFQEPEEWCMDATTWFDYFDKNLPLMRKRYAALKEQGVADNMQTTAQTWNNWQKRLRDIRLDNYGNKRSFDRGMARADGLTYALRVTNFGIYNCDQIFILRDDEVYLFAAYKTSDGQRIVPKNVCVMERKRRICFGMWKPEKMLYAPNYKLDIVVMDTSGRFYYMPAADYEKADLKDRKSYTFTVEDVTKKIQTPRDWAELLEI